MWYISADPRLSVTAKHYIDHAELRGDEIGVSAISLAELVYLIEKKRVHPHALDELLRALANPVHVFVEVPVDNAVVRAMPHIPRADVPDLPDRIIAATALRLGVPVITRDAKIRTANLRAIW